MKSRATIIIKKNSMPDEIKLHLPIVSVVYGRHILNYDYV